MTAEVAAAVRGALAAGAELVTVNEGHDGMRNLIPEDLPREARLITGHHKRLSMVEGVDEPGVGALIFTGYHAKAGTPNGVLAHTYIGQIHDIRLDGVSVGEYGVNAATAGHFGVPVAMVTSDDVCVEQVKELLGDGIIGVVVKRGLGVEAANHVHPAVAQEMIEAGAEEAIRRALAGEFQPYRIRPGCRVEVDLQNQEITALSSLVPGIDRVGDRSVAFSAANGEHLMLTWRAMLNALLSRFAV
jgi:D-amino peptidase